MDAGLIFSTSNLIWLAFSLQLLGFAARDELKLRLLMLTGGLTYVVYFVLISGGPLWSSVITNALLVSINLAVTMIVIHERTMLGIKGETADIYRRFSLLRPGQFRKLLKAGEVRTAQGTEALIEEGRPVEALFYVLDGTTLVTKAGQSKRIGADVFLGEVAFLTGSPASATVHLEEGSRYIAWRHDALARITERDSNMRLAIIALLNKDMAQKIAISMPVAQTANN